MALNFDQEQIDYVVKFNFVTLEIESLLLKIILDNFANVPNYFLSRKDVVSLISSQNREMLVKGEDVLKLNTDDHERLRGFFLDDDPRN